MTNPSPFKNISVQSVWREFAEIVFAGQKISTVQRREMERAFYTGFGSLFALMSKISQYEGPESHSLELLESFGEELESFFTALDNN